MLLGAFALIAAWGCAGSSSSGAEARQPDLPGAIPSPDAGEGLFLEGFFPIGVFSQPVESFERWQSRGINTILEVPQNHDPAAWDRAAQAAGLRIIRRPLADPRSDIGRKDLLAWSHWDEPDAAGRIFEWTPMFERTAEEWRGIDPNRKIFINFAGPDVSWFTSRDDEYSRRYASHYPRLIATADWVANDLYPNGGWLNDAHKGRRGDITLLGEPIRALKALTDKPQFAFIEASEIEYGNVAGARAPSPQSMRAQIWYALTLGVRGIFYFPAVVGTRGFQFDGTTPAIVEEMTRQNKILASLAPVLQGEVNPAGLSARAPSPIAAGWRKAEGEALFILVNTSEQPVRGARIELTGTSPNTDARSAAGAQITKLQQNTAVLDFEPHGVHVLLVKTD